MACPVIGNRKKSTTAASQSTGDTVAEPVTGEAPEAPIPVSRNKSVRTVWGSEFYESYQAFTGQTPLARGLDCLDLGDKRRDGGLPGRAQAVVSHLEDGRFRILVDGHDHLAALHAGQVLNGA